MTLAHAIFDNIACACKCLVDYKSRWWVSPVDYKFTRWVTLFSPVFRIVNETSTEARLLGSSFMTPAQFLVLVYYFCALIQYTFMWSKINYCIL